MTRSILPLAAIISLILTSLVPVSLAYAENPFPDVDGDGLSNEMEAAGWYNQAGGPFVTNPYDADSDDDGLADGEEMLFGANPLDARAPGIYVRYQSNYKTREYFRIADPAYLSMKQAGDKYLMTEAMVVRRGTTFFIGGPISGTLTMTGSGLTDLSPYIVKDIYGGGWSVSLPTNGTAGTYTAAISWGAWQKQMPIYVIFELPTPSADLSQQKIDAFLYNDDPADKRDETAVIWYAEYPKDIYTRRCDAGNPPPCYNANNFYHIARGYSEAVYTKQYQKWIFIDKVIGRIQGKTNQVDATTALSQGADQEVRVNYSNFGQGGQSGQPLAYQMSYILGRSYDGTGYTQDGTACSSNAAAFTTFLRSAGILSRPFITDWWASSWDTAVMVWLNNQWYGGRSYRQQEISDQFKYYPFAGGDTARDYLENWDSRGGYRENNSNILVVANENWTWQMVNTGHVYDDMTEANREYEWDTIAPLEMPLMHPGVDTLMTIVWEGEPWLPTGWPAAYRLPSPYPGGNINENWPIEPVPQACPPGYPDCPYLDAGLGTAASGAQSAQSRSNRVYLPFVVVGNAQPKPVQLGDVVGDYGMDTDGDGRFDDLMVEVEVEALQPGTYTLGGALGGMAAGKTSYGEIYADNARVYLRQGKQVVHLRFDGLTIGNTKTNGAFRVTGLWITDLEDFDPRLGPWDEVLDAKESDYATARYLAEEFERVAASFADQYSRRGVDRDGDGQYESVEIDVTLDIAQPGTYRVEGDLYGGTGDWIGHAAWSGSEAVATLDFGLNKTSGPYTLANLRVYDDRGRLLDVRQDDAYTFAGVDGQVINGPVSLNVYAAPSGQLGPLGTYITPTQVFTGTGVDLNGNGKYDQLRVDVGVQVSRAGQYRVDGWLESSDGTLLAYALGDFTNLTPGVRTLSMAFDGRVLNARGVVSGSYTLVAVRALDSNSSYSVADQVQVTGRTFPHNAAAFEPANKSTLIFHDDMESGAGNWTSQAPWDINQRAWPKPSWVWRANAYGSQSGSLTADPLNVSDSARLLLRFNTTYGFPSSNNAGYLEASKDGVTWTKVATYTNATNRSATEVVDLSSFGKSPDLRLRFRANSQTGLLWYVDDVYLNGWPAETTASFTYSPQPVIVGGDTTFAADYTFLTLTLPITFTWNFGDGSPIVRLTNTTTVTHQFPQALDYTVVLTVANVYDSASDSNLVSAYALLNTYTVGPGSVYKNPDQSMYRHGNVVTLTAVAGPGASFAGWSGSLGGATNPQAITINGNKVVTATFAEAEYHLTVNTVGSGSVMTTPALPHYHYGNVVTLTATAAPGWTFDRWSGDVDSTANPVTLTMNADKTVSAVFTQNDYTLMVNVPGGGGNVAKNPNQPHYHYGDVVTLTANANTGWTFAGWSGDLTGGANPGTLTINGNKTVTATFSMLEYTLSVNTSGSGSVTKNPTKSTYHYGEVVALTASANTGWSFGNWSGDLTGSQNPKTITIDGNKTVLGTFNQIEYTLTTNVSGGGSVSKNPSQATYHYGEVVTLTASANTGWSFANWSGDLTGSQNPKTITLDGNKSVTANFTQLDYALTINVVGGGSVTKNPSQTTYHYGDVVNLTAIANTGWEFSAWSGDLSGSANPTSITIYGNRTVTATFNRLGYTLSTGVSGGGSITRNPDKPTYLYGELVTLTANADTYWSFSGWSGDLSGTTNPQTLVMNGPKSAIASFSPNGYLLNITLDGSGTVSKNPNKSVYQNGEVVTLTANANTGWTFTGWSGDMGGSQNPKTITMNGDKNVTASFSSDEYTLKVNNVGSGYVAKNPSKSFYYYGDVVTLTANPLAGYAFSGWSGDLSGSTNPATITIISNKNVTATYTFVGFVLTTNISGSGSVARNPDQATYISGTVVALTANAGPGWTFSSWSGAATGSSNPISVTMTGNKVVTATFSANDYALTIVRVGNGSVTRNPEQAHYHYGEAVTLTAAPDPGWAFTSWSGGLSGSTNPATITINGNKTVTATFSPAEYTLTLNTSGGGTAAKSPNLAHYHYGDVVTLTATANTGRTFTGWSGSLGGSTNPVTLTMNGSKNITANFAPIEYSLMVNLDGSGGVARYPDQPTYHYGDVVTLTATANSGWSFDVWSGHLSGSGNPKSIVINGNKVVLATFVRNEFVVTANVSGSGNVTRNPDLTYYGPHAVVTLTAIPNPGWTFGGWSGDLTGSANPATLTVNSHRVVTATFNQNDYALTVRVAGGGNAYRAPELAHYHYGDVVTLTAVAAPGWTFGQWSGGLTGSASPQTITITGSKVVTATFNQQDYVLTIGATGSGSVARSPILAHYHYGDIVVLTATASLGWSLIEWSGDLGGSDNPAAVTIYGDTNIMAAFTQDEYTLTVSPVGSGSVGIVPVQAHYHYGDVVTLTATPDGGMAFTGWSGDWSGLVNPQPIAMTGTRNITATFDTIRPLTGVSFTFAPPEPKKGAPVTFSTLVTPSSATPPITYTWGFGDGSAQVITRTSSVAHTFTSVATYTVWLTATNGYSAPVVYHREVIVAKSDYFTYLPVVLRQK